MSNERSKQPWIYSPAVDGLFILLPAFLALAAVMLFPSYFIQQNDVPVLAWVVLILLIDVAHVYSTLYRTYFDKGTFNERKRLLWYIPLFAWIAGVIVYSIDGILFWRILAYLAVYHFIRQQYGFMRIYSRRENYSKYQVLIDKAAIYYAAAYPILFWHMHAPRNFNWFVEGDFLYFESRWLSTAALALYMLVITIYLVKEITVIIRTKSFNIPRNAIIAGTFISWYFGIVHYNGDLAFTTINVASHGIPYMALVWIYGKKKYGSAGNSSSKGLNLKVFSRYGITLFLLIIFILAFVEEGVWDAMVWKDHPQLFGSFSFLPYIRDSKVLAVLVPLLSLPQVTHYIIDGFIWKMSKDNYNWKKITLEK